MKIDVDTLILNEKNEPIRKDPNDEKSEALTLASVCASSLLINHPDFDKKVDGHEKFKRTKLIMKFAAGGEQEFSVQEIAYIMDRVGNVAPTWSAGKAWEILDPEGEIAEKNIEKNKMPPKYNP